MVTQGTGKCSECPHVGELGDGLCATCYDKLITQQSRKPRPGYSLHLSRTPSNRRKESNDPDTSDSSSSDHPGSP